MAEPPVADESNTVGTVAYYKKTLQGAVDRMHHTHKTNKILITDEDTEHVVNIANVYLSKDDDWFAFDTFVDFLLHHALPNLSAYGDDGNGDKKPDMNRMEYWLSHIEDDLIEQARSVMAKRPPAFVVFQSDKPPSSAPKCTMCKTKMSKKSLGIKKRRVSPSMYPFASLPEWNVTTQSVVCSSPSCRRKLAITNKPVVEGAVSDDNMACAMEMVESFD